jgi:hypothetical protein
VFYDIGLLYAQMNDHDRAVAAVRLAIIFMSRCATLYEPVRNTLAGFARR